MARSVVSCTSVKVPDWPNSRAPDRAGAVARAATDLSSVRRSMVPLIVKDVGCRFSQNREKRHPTSFRLPGDFHRQPLAAGLADGHLQLRALGDFPDERQAQAALAGAALAFVASEALHGHQLRELLV